MARPAAVGRDVLPARLRAQLLAGAGPRDVRAVARRLLAIQAQDPRGARLAVRARSTGLVAADVDAALNRGELIITWLNRGTLHLVASEDYAWLHALTAPPLRTAIEGRLGRLGVSAAAAQRALRTIESSLAEEGPLERDRLRELLARAGAHTEGQAFIQQLALASLHGLIVRGPMLASRHAIVLTRDWLGSAATVGASFSRERALAELARRYLAGHEPAGERDLARWAGLPLRDARAGLGAIAAELEQRPDGLVQLRRRPRGATKLPPPRLLGSFEPLLLGWTSRAEVLAGHDAQIVSGGIFRAFALAEGRAVAGWRLEGRKVVLSPFSPLTPELAAALAADAADVERFLGLAGRARRAA